MFYDEFQAAGPTMYAVFAAWVLVFAGVLDRLLYTVGRTWRRPLRRIRRRARTGDRAAATLDLDREQRRAQRGVARIDSISQLATSIGLFGTVLGIAHAFFDRAASSDAPADALSSGFATALFTTVGGLVVYLFGQGFLIIYGEYLVYSERSLAEDLLAGEAN